MSYSEVAPVARRWNSRASSQQCWRAPLHSAANTLPITRERIRSSSVPSHDNVVLEIIKDKARSGSEGRR